MGCPQTTVWGAQVLVLFVGGLLHAVIACVLAVSPTVFGRYASAVELRLLWFVCGKQARRWRPNARTQREAERGERRGRARGHGTRSDAAAGRLRGRLTLRARRIVLVEERNIVGKSGHLTRM